MNEWLQKHAIAFALSLVGTIITLAFLGGTALENLRQRVGVLEIQYASWNRLMESHLLKHPAPAPENWVLIDQAVDRVLQHRGYRLPQPDYYRPGPSPINRLPEHGDPP